MCICNSHQVKQINKRHPTEQRVLLIQRHHFTSSFLDKVLETSLLLCSDRFPLLNYSENLYAVWIQYFLNTMSSSYQIVLLNQRQEHCFGYASVYLKEQSNVNPFLFPPCKASRFCGEQDRFCYGDKEQFNIRGLLC